MRDDGYDLFGPGVEGGEHGLAPSEGGGAGECVGTCCGGVDGVDF